MIQTHIRLGNGASNQYVRLFHPFLGGFANPSSTAAVTVVVLVVIIVVVIVGALVYCKRRCKYREFTL